MNQTHIPAILDIEASGFGKGSYPIEIGVATESGETFSWLVKPEDDWVHWNEEAAELHKISRQELFEKGLSCREIAQLLNEKFEGQTIYSDGWGVDSGWLALLFYTAGQSMYFKLDTLPKVMTQFQLEHWDLTKELLREKYGWQHHRAGIDAHLLQLTYQRTAIEEQLS
ncbi:hypothetical protein [Reinekea thalattae]|uniref:Exonuclease domain-containing protein n=1 Tax=Reinekea thalattae TaxID=2593301 RepID=A0A5C8Z8K5_9GAMM|nr:hypothetical protein [Reinekea thalattae]TXR53598.1 hypothetical protein FME95_03270 [Reinekea thalattae]